METENKDLIAKLEEYKNSMGSRMADQLDGMIASNRENIRMKCLEAALKFYELKSKEPLRISKSIDTFEITDKGLKDLAEEFYQFVKGDSLHKSE